MGALLLVLAALSGPARCHARGELPDPLCTPGAAGTTDIAIVCDETTRARRHVTAWVRRLVLAEYGYASAPARGTIEVDHLIPLELGGSNDVANLWPEPAPGFHRKDRLENQLHREVCAGRMELREAQDAIARDWVEAASEESTLADERAR